jgi:glycosyltransferase involved in cell wall biosynthesis
MKIHILFPFKEGAAGGGNQFLKALKQEWQKQGVYEENLPKAQVVLFNNHHCLREVFRAKKKFPQKIFIHRLDGPMRAYRKKEAFLDRLIFKTNSFVADGIVWQSQWSQEQNKKIFLYNAVYQTVIYNAPDEKIFNKRNKTPFHSNKKIKLVGASWSSNPLKGFHFYQYLDTHLDFQKYEMTFVGRSPVVFQNIKMIEPQTPQKLADILKQNDIFIFASQVESCSNALIEALSCGLPCVAFRGSSNPEIVKQGGEFFESPAQLISKIDKVASNYSFYEQKLPVFSLQKTAKQYFDFAQKIFDDSKSGYYIIKEVGARALLAFYKEYLFSYYWKIFNKLRK